MKFKINDRVTLITKCYGATKYNPYYKSEYYCIGTIINRTPERVLVEWDNGHANDYFDTDLDLFDNKLENCNNIW